MKRGQQLGFTYLMVMFAIVLIGLASVVAAQPWGIIAKREQEADLLFRGREYRRAIALYCQTSRPGRENCPKELKDLLGESEAFKPRRYIRRLWSDPVTRGDFILVRDPQGRIRGVRSASPDPPLKSAGFTESETEFERASRYCEWVFLYRAPGAPALPPIPAHADGGNSTSC